MKLLLALFWGLGVYIGGLQSANIRAEDNLGPCPDGYTGLVPHPTFCPFYYLCNNGVPNLLECPSGLYFNPSMLACDFPENVEQCQGGTWPPVSPTDRTTTPEGPETEGTVGPTSTSGPETEGTVNTMTTTRPTTTSTRPTTTNPGSLTCPSNPSIFMPYPGDCNKYYLCENGSLIGIHNCPTGLWFRSSMQVCMTPWGSDCINSEF